MQRFFTLIFLVVPFLLMVNCGDDRNGLEPRSLDRFAFVRVVNVAPTGTIVSDDDYVYDSGAYFQFQRPAMHKGKQVFEDISFFGDLPIPYGQSSSVISIESINPKHVSSALSPLGTPDFGDNLSFPIYGAEIVIPGADDIVRRLPVSGSLQEYFFRGLSYTFVLHEPRWHASPSGNSTHLAIASYSTQQDVISSPGYALVRFINYIADYPSPLLIKVDSISGKVSDGSSLSFSEVGYGVTTPYELYPAGKIGVDHISLYRSGIDGLRADEEEFLSSNDEDIILSSQGMYTIFIVGSINPDASLEDIGESRAVSMLTVLDVSAGK